MKSNQNAFEPVLVLVFSASGQPVTVDLASSEFALRAMREQHETLAASWRVAEVPLSVVLGHCPPREGSACADVIVPSRSELAAAMLWLSDCEWPDVEADGIAGMPAAQIVRAVQVHYVGGWGEFVKTTRPWSESNPSGFTVKA